MTIADPTIHDLAATVDRYREFTRNWNIPENPATLKMWLACTMERSMEILSVTNVADKVWEAYYQAVLTQWIAGS